MRVSKCIAVADATFDGVILHRFFLFALHRAGFLGFLPLVLVLPWVCSFLVKTCNKNQGALLAVHFSSMLIHDQGFQLRCFSLPTFPDHLQAGLALCCFVLLCFRQIDLRSGPDAGSSASGAAVQA